MQFGHAVEGLDHSSGSSGTNPEAAAPGQLSTLAAAQPNHPRSARGPCQSARRGAAVAEDKFPEHLREGAWSPVAYIFLVAFVSPVAAIW